jgi:hypothetical protein
MLMRAMMDRCGRFSSRRVVVATGNHFFLDAAAGALLAVSTWAVVTRTGAWLTVRRATRPWSMAEQFLLTDDQGPAEGPDLPRPSTSPGS